MIDALNRIQHHLGSAVWRPLWASWAGAPRPVRQPATDALTPDWRTPAYLRRRVSGDGLACPWPPRQH